MTELGLIISKGKTQGTEYKVNPEFLKKVNFKGKTNLKGIENHRLEELIYQDIKIYQPTSIGDIHLRIGKEINIHRIRRMLKEMVFRGILSAEGEKKYRTYSIEQKG